MTKSYISNNFETQHYDIFRFADVFALLAQPNATGITDFNFMDVSAVYDVSREVC